MLSGIRSCLNTKKQTYTVPKQQLNEPLLFLYPRWFRTAAAARQHPEKASIVSPGPVWLDLGQIAPRESSGSTTSSTRPPRRAAGDPYESVSQATSGVSGVAVAHPSQDGIANVPSKSRADLATAKSLCRGSESTSRSYNDMTASQRGNDLGATDSTSNPPSTYFINTRPTEDIENELTKVRIRRTRQTAYRQVLAKSPRSDAKSIKKEATRKLHDPAGIEWSEQIRLLAQLVYRPKVALGERLELCRNTVFHLTGSIDTNAWFHQVGWGCEIRVLKEHASDPDKLVVVLHGMARARRLTREYLLQADRDVVNSALWSLSPEDEPKLIRFVLSSLKWHHRTKDVRRADTVENPRSWTVRSFAEVIETLTRMQIPYQLQRELHEGTESHNRTVARVIENLFSDPLSAPFISSRALNDALHFTSKHTEISDTSNFLFEKARMLGLTLQADTFNILIEASLRQNNLGYYQSLLANMRQMRVAPDGMTWLALLRLTKLRTGRQAILHCLRQKWPKDSTLWRQVALELVSTEFAQLVRVEKGFDYFVDFMDHSCPSAWLSTRCINQMLGVCAKKKLWDIVPRILDFGERRGGYFNTATQTMLLAVFQRRGSIQDSINLLESHFAKTVDRDSSSAIPTIFMTAWNSRFYNVCRVLWHYAALHGIITSSMQYIVALSLTRNNDKSSDSASHLWRITAGKVIAGVDLGSLSVGTKFRFLDEEGLLDPMKILAQWTPEDGTRQEQLNLAMTVIHRDLTAYKRFRHLPSQQLVNTLRKAYEMDCDWMHNKKVRRYTDLSWMMESAIKVPLQPLADPSASPQHLLSRMDADTS